MRDKSVTDQIESLQLAANTLKYGWSITAEDERADAKKEGLEQQYDWYENGYLAAISELEATATLLTELAKGNVADVTGL